MFPVSVSGLRPVSSAPLTRQINGPGHFLSARSDFLSDFTLRFLPAKTESEANSDCSHSVSAAVRFTFLEVRMRPVGIWIRTFQACLKILNLFSL